MNRERETGREVDVYKGRDNGRDQEKKRVKESETDECSPDIYVLLLLLLPHGNKGNPCSCQNQLSQLDVPFMYK